MRKIIHVDMDAFFAAVEQRDNPQLKGKPVIIGGQPNTRGVVSTCSYEARKYGVHSAMSLTEAYRRCPQGIFMRGNHAKYRTASRQLIKILNSFSPLVEPLSIDEAFLDVTGCERLFGPITEIARKIKIAIVEELNLTASVGCAPNKFLAKIASDLKKPDGLVVVDPDKIHQFLHPLPITKLWGVGEKTATRLQKLGFRKVKDIAQTDPELLERHFGKQGHHLYQLANGIDSRPVITSHEIKSVGHEHTFTYDTGDIGEIKAKLLKLVEKVAFRLRKEEGRGRTITLKLRYSDFKTLTRSTTLATPTDIEKTIYEAAEELLNKVVLINSIRLIGVTISKLTFAEDGRQMSLFEESYQKQHQLAEVVDVIKEKYGEDSIELAGTKKNRKYLMEPRKR